MNPELTPEVLAALKAIDPEWLSVFVTCRCKACSSVRLIAEQFPALLAALLAAAEERDQLRKRVVDQSKALADVVECSSDKVLLLQARVKELEAGLKAVDDLISDSRGVCGLHRNGDEAPWAELRTGGRYEEWLTAFDQALKGGAK